MRWGTIAVAFLHGAMLQVRVAISKDGNVAWYIDDSCCWDGRNSLPKRQLLLLRPRSWRLRKRLQQKKLQQRKLQKRRCMNMTNG